MPRRARAGWSEPAGGNGRRSPRSSSSRPRSAPGRRCRCRCRGSRRTRWSTACSGAGSGEHGSLDILGGPTPYYSLLTPLLAGFPLAAFGLDSGLRRAAGAPGAGDVAGGGARVPVGTLARLARGRPCVAAALAVAVPGLTYSGLVMTEVLFYPLLVLAAWAAAEAIVRPTWQAQRSLVAAFLAVARRRGCRRSSCCLRSATAVGLDAVDRRARGPACGSSGRRSPGFGGARARLARLAARVRRRPRSAATRSSPTPRTASGGAAKYVVYHLADLLILCGARSRRCGGGGAARPGAAPRRARPARARVPRGRVLARRLVRARGRRSSPPSTPTGSSSGT